MKINEMIAAAMLLLISVAIISSTLSQNANASPGECDVSGTCPLYGSNDLGAQGAETQTTSASSGEGELKVIQLSYSGGYYVPREIRVNEGDRVRIEFDQSKFRGCMTTFNIYDLGIKVYVPSQSFVEFVANKPGVYRTGCNMGMGDGRFIVEPAAGGKQLAQQEPAPLPPEIEESGCGGGGCGCGCGG
ncbi:MAG: cupredoxin domain-containing protein [Candidatus Micrarchaeota archaeon]